MQNFLKHAVGKHNKCKLELEKKTSTIFQSVCAAPTFQNNMNKRTKLTALSDVCSITWRGIFGKMSRIEEALIYL